MAHSKVRYADDFSFGVDMIGTYADRVQCVTDPMNFDGATTVIASGSLSLEPLGVLGHQVGVTRVMGGRRPREPWFRR